MAKCMKGVHLKRLGEAVHGLAAFAPQERGWIFLKRADPRTVEYAFTADEAQKVRKAHEQNREDWLEVEFCGAEQGRRPTTGFTVTVQADGAAEERIFRAGSPKVGDGSELRQTDPDPSWIDAIFFTRSAVEKFLIPYYTSLYGVEVAQTMLERYEEGMVALHGPISIQSFERTDESALEDFVTVDELAWPALE